MPGAAWRIETVRGEVFEGCAGDASRIPCREAAALDTVYDLASLTKPLATALLALLLAEDGALSAEADASDWLPELRGTAYEGASLADLASHRAGLPAWRPLYLRARTLDEYVRAIASEPPVGAPGATLYSDLGYILLGAVLERATGARLDALFDARIAGPLGRSDIGFAATGGRFPLAAPTEHGNAYEREMAGEEGQGFAWRTRMIRGEPHDANAHGVGGVGGHAGLFGTAAAVAAIALEMFRPRRLALGGRSLTMLLDAPGGRGRTFGLTPARESQAARGILADAAPGMVGFTGTSFWIDLDAGAVYVLLSNRVHPRVPPADFSPVRSGFHRAAVVTVP